MRQLGLTLIACFVLSACAQMERVIGKDDTASTESTATASGAAEQTSKAAPAPSASAESAPRSSTTRASASESESGIYGNPPAGSPFAKVELGMSYRQVIDLIGEPTDQKAYVTGKAWIPFYFGEDRSRMEYRYKGQGVITFAGSGGFSSAYKVSRVIYNPNESGYNK